MNAVATFDLLASRARHIFFACTDPHHVHNSPVQELYALPYNGHKVSITQDGNEYDVMIDDEPRTVRERLNKAQMIDYVERSCRNK